ncbi:PPOX class F420-dependent oxidoreductase [Dactylosporangium sp. NPDC005555]|uniref:PPOX class F420-dependent oxidoreductase n=1 Tax=Dactylosporangium sp. NPDC005555 TaxID=3154889 RepID=UPI0033B56B9E
MTSAAKQLGDEAYIAVTTFRRDGTPVSTPVWVAPEGEALMVWTVRDSGKVKRIRRDGKVTVAPCTVRGVPTGDAVPGHATILDAEGGKTARELIKRKYGLRGRLFVWMSVRRRGADGTVGVRITLV